MNFSDYYPTDYDSIGFGLSGSKIISVEVVLTPVICLFVEVFSTNFLLRRAKLVVYRVQQCVCLLFTGSILLVLKATVICYKLANKPVRFICVIVDLFTLLKLDFIQLKP